MAGVRIPYLVALPSGFYWQPSRRLRRLGFRPESLGKDEATAIAKALSLNADAEREGEIEARLLPAEIPGTVANAIAAYKGDPSYTSLRPNTRTTYDYCLRQIERWAGDQPLEELTVAAVREWYGAMHRKNPTKANHVIKVLRIVLGMQVANQVIVANPAAAVSLTGVPPRQVIWTPEAIEAFCRAAIEAGKPSLALALRIALDTGQRQSDVLRLRWSQWDGEGVELRQSKTGAVVRVPATPELRDAIEAAPRDGLAIVICEATKQPYKRDWFRHEFGAMAERAGTSAYWFLDLRRTAVVHLARAGSTLPEIVSITGHTTANAKNIVDTYLPRDAEMAQAGIRKLNDYRRPAAASGNKSGAAIENGD